MLRRWKIIQNAVDLYEFAQEQLQVPLEKASLSRRNFFYVEQHERERPRRYFKEVSGYRAIYSILAHGQSEHLKTRDLSCYCDHCIAGDFDNCDNPVYVKGWDQQILEQEAPERRATRNDVAEVREELLDLVTKNCIVAIASGDVGDYYLLNVISDHAETLTMSVTDDCNAQYRAGSSVIHGLFCVGVDCQQSSSNRFFKLVTDISAYGYSSTVRFICSELEEQGNGGKFFMHLECLISLVPWMVVKLRYSSNQRGPRVLRDFSPKHKESHRAFISVMSFEQRESSLSLIELKYVFFQQILLSLKCIWKDLSMIMLSSLCSKWLRAVCNYYAHSKG